MRTKRTILCLSLLFDMVFTTAYAQTAHPQQYKYVFTVAKDGTGDYKYIQDAIDAMRAYPLATITLYIKNGVYNEKIELPATNTDVTFIGESVEKTIIVFNDHSGRGKLNTFTSYTAKISGNRFVAENITFQNSAGRVGQALALYVDADKAIFRNCRFLGDQDTIFASGERSRQYFVDCYIEGTTDFIFGPATALFERCTVHCKLNSFITAASTPKGKKFGFVFLHCNITADSAVTKIALGRPWRAYSNTVYLYCGMPVQIVPQGWNNWGNPENEQTAFYAEYHSTGAGANPRARAAWSRQLSDKEAGQYTPQNILADGNSIDQQDPDWFGHTTARPFEWPAEKPKTGAQR